MSAEQIAELVAALRGHNDDRLYPAVDDLLGRAANMLEALSRQLATIAALPACRSATA